MARTLFRSTVTLATAVALTATMFLGVGLWRRSEDTKWCRHATMSATAPGDPQDVTPGLIDQQRSLCAVHRQRQRVMFGSVWRSGGQAMAGCGFDLARLQVLSDQAVRRAILAASGLDDTDFEASTRQDQDRFIRACVAGGRPVGAAEGSASTGAAPSDTPVVTSPSPGLELEPTATCPREAIDELSGAIAFVRGQSWADRPGSNPLNISPDLTACRVVLNVGHLSDLEEAALQAGGGSRLAIEYRRDWARPSRLLLMLWVVFGGSGVIWVYRRYARR